MKSRFFESKFASGALRSARILLKTANLLNRSEALDKSPDFSKTRQSKSPEHSGACRFVLFCNVDLDLQLNDLNCDLQTFGCGESSMLKIKSSQVLLGFSFLPLILVFVNCSQKFAVSNGSGAALLQRLVLAKEASAKDQVAQSQLDGIYAMVDALGKCGRSTENQIPIREQIEIFRGVALKTFENCQQLQTPILVPWGSLQASSLNGNVLIFQNQIFERSTWSSSGFAPRDKYIDIYCSGRDKKIQKAAKQNLEITLLSSSQSFYVPASGQTSNSNSLPDNPLLARRGELQTYFKNNLTSEITDSQASKFLFRETISIDPMSGDRYYFFEVAGESPSFAKFSFELNFSQSKRFISGAPLQLDFGILQSDKNSSTSMCWSH